MSSPIVDMARSPFSTAAFAQLVRRLRHTNARYNQIARQLRCRIRPTHHAKRRAYRAGLRIDISKTRACSTKAVSVRSLPIIDTSGVSPSWVDPPVYVPAENGVGVSIGVDAANERHSASPGEACMRGLPSPRSSPGVGARKSRRRDGRQRVMLRVPPLKLSLGAYNGCGAPCQGPVPGAPRLMPRQLPEEESGVEEMMLAPASSLSSFMDDPDLLLTPPDARVCSGLCITIPPRGVKRKLQDSETDESIVPSQQPKRVLRARWNELQRQ